MNSNNGSHHLTRPPVTPKASKTNERQKQLQDRLKLSWAPKIQFRGESVQSPHIAGVPDLRRDIGEGLTVAGLDSSAQQPPPQSLPHHVKGFGEQHFADSTYDHDGGGGLNEGSSVWTDKIPYEQSIISRKIAGERTSPPHLTLNFQSLTHPQQNNRTQLLQSFGVGDTISQLPKSTTGYKSKLQSHLSYSQTLHEDGMEGVVNSFMQKDAGFCYLDSQSDDFYQFDIKGDVPASILQNRFTTLSVNGIMRATGDKSELVDFSTLARERTIYLKLQDLNLFRTYRAWKSFFVWKKSVHRTRFVKRVSFS
jgi:hypothetical protein